MKTLNAAETQNVIAQFKRMVRMMGATDRAINLALEECEERLVELLEEREEDEAQEQHEKEVDYDDLSEAEKDVYWSNQFGAYEAEQEARAFMNDLK
jgi:hypothetical protein